MAAWERIALTVLIAKRQLSYYIIFFVSLIELMESSDYFICGAVIIAAISDRDQGCLAEVRGKF